MVFFSLLFFVNNKTIQYAKGIEKIAITGNAVNINIPRKAKTSTPSAERIGMCKNPANDIPKDNIVRKINRFLFVKFFLIFHLSLKFTT